MGTLHFDGVSFLPFSSRMIISYLILGSSLWPTFKRAKRRCSSEPPPTHSPKEVHNELESTNSRCNLSKLYRSSKPLTLGQLGLITTPPRHGVLKSILTTRRRFWGHSSPTVFEKAGLIQPHQMDSNGRLSCPTSEIDVIKKNVHLRSVIISKHQ